MALALVNEYIYVLSPFEELGASGEVIYKADFMLNYTFTEFEGFEMSNAQAIDVSAQHHQENHINIPQTTTASYPL